MLNLKNIYTDEQIMGVLDFLEKVIEAVIEDVNKLKAAQPTPSAPTTGGEEHGG